VELTSIKPPDFESAHYRVDARLLRYTDVWEKINLSEKDLLAYFQQHRQTLDPIEGIWSDGSADRIAIIRNTAEPGRDFVAFMLNVELPSWQTGYKKMEIARTDRTGDYSLRYYRHDFGVLKTTMLLEQGRRFSFIISSDDQAAQVTYLKIGAPQPLN